MYILVLLTCFFRGVRARVERVLFLIKAREFGGLEIVLLDWLSRIEYSKVSVVL